MQQPLSPSAENYLEALQHANVVDHVLNVALEDGSAEIALLDSIQGIAAGPVFRVARGCYAFRLPAEQIAPLTEALAEADGTLRALASGGRVAPVLDDVGVALVQAVGEAADTAAPVLTQAVVSAAFAVEAARLAADGIDAGAGMEALRTELADIRQELQRGDGGGRPPGERWIVDLATQTELALRHLTSEDVARKDDVMVLGTRIEAVLSAFREASAAEETAFALFRERLERLQETSDKVAAYLDREDAEQRVDTALLSDLEAQLNAALSSMEGDAAAFGPFLPGAEDAQADPGRAAEPLRHALSLLAELSERADRDDPAQRQIQELRARLEEFGRADGAALAAIRARIEDVSARQDEAAEAASTEMQSALTQLGQRLDGARAAVSDLVAGSVSAAAERTVAGLDDLKAGLDMRLQTVISRDGGLAENIDRVEAEIGGLKRLIEAAEGEARTAEMMAALGDLAAKLGGLEEMLERQPEAGAEATRGLFAALEARLSGALEAVQTQGAEVLDLAQRIETPEARRIPFEALGAETRAAHQTLGENIARISNDIGAQEARLAEALNGIEMRMERQGARLDAVDAGAAKGTALAEMDSRLQAH
ncbi:MAG: hypothetical protein AAFY59_07155, partial [Pseudomonadota bacterium]